MQQLSVSSLVRYLKNKIDLDNNLQRVLVSGEISNYHRHFSGHLYFSLKDEAAQINCVMFKSAAATLNFEPKNGDQVLLMANTSIYETSGQLQLYVLKMNQLGLGDLYAKYEALKKKLEENGIFENQHKIAQLNLYPEKVAVLVGDKSAAMSDIKTTFLRRWPLCQVDFYPVLVQGTDAPISIIEKLKIVDELNYDAIILARGGGSFEDLYCFNDENLVMCIYHLKTFIITGVGHEQDFTLVDFVADSRAATPTAAVELITPNIEDLKEEINDYQNKLNLKIKQLIDLKIMNFDYYLAKIKSFSKRCALIKSDLDNLCLNMNKCLLNKIEYQKILLKRYETLIEAYSVNKTLERGYSLVIQDDKIIKRKQDLKNEAFSIKFIDGVVKGVKIDG